MFHNKLFNVNIWKKKYTYRPKTDISRLCRNTFIMYGYFDLRKYIFINSASQNSFLEKFGLEPKMDLMRFSTQSFFTLTQHNACHHFMPFFLYKKSNNTTLKKALRLITIVEVTWQGWDKTQAQNTGRPLQQKPRPRTIASVSNPPPLPPFPTPTDCSSSPAPSSRHRRRRNFAEEPSTPAPIRWPTATSRGGSSRCAPDLITPEQISRPPPIRFVVSSLVFV